jgi:hypothetical protein
MENVLVKVMETSSPAAVNAGAPVALKVGVVSYASDILETFTKDAEDTSRLDTLRRVADQLTCEQFKDTLKEAQKMADAIDAANGFKPAEKPQSIEERYGLKRRVFNQRMSEAKRLFGVLKQAPEVLKEKGYFQALNASREWLKSNGKEWDGATSLTKEEKAMKADSKVAQAALADVMAANPMIPGESIGAYNARITAIAEKAVADAKEKAHVGKVASLAATLAEKYDADLLIGACLRILEAGDIADIEYAMSYLADAKAILILAEQQQEAAE